MPDLPMPVSTTLPRHAAITRTARSNSGDMFFMTDCSASISISKTALMSWSIVLFLAIGPGLSYAAIDVLESGRKRLCGKLTTRKRAAIARVFEQALIVHSFCQVHSQIFH